MSSYSSNVCSSVKNRRKQSNWKNTNVLWGIKRPLKIYCSANLQNLICWLMNCTWTTIFHSFARVLCYFVVWEIRRYGTYHKDSCDLCWKILDFAWFKQIFLCPKYWKMWYGARGSSWMRWRKMPTDFSRFSWCLLMIIVIANY